ncbi:glycosyl transferase [Paraburkholderia sp. Se-20369]|nr:glycosyl transferase [Paraburkholderia sp. Se-20369]TCW85898.1 glycosyl transferase [Burkholderia sp. SRS-46]
MKKKILLACSNGGHYVQLSLMVSAFSDHEVVWAVSGNKELQAGNDGYRLIDANKQTPVKLAGLACQVMKILAVERPDIVVSTGAAPGLFAVVFGRMLGAKTVWIDSIANSARLSLSGRIARHFASETLTQWRHLETPRVRYWGGVI